MAHPKVTQENILWNKYGKKFVIRTYQADDGYSFDWASIDIRDSVIIVSITSSSQVLLVHQYRFNLYEYSYEHPAGGLENNEDPLLAAQRELFEETGYKSNKIISLGKFSNMPGDTNRWVNIFLAQDIIKEAEPPLDTDVEKYFDMSLKLVSFSEAESIITGLEHLFALSLAKKYLNLK